MFAEISLDCIGCDHGWQGLGISWREKNIQIGVNGERQLSATIVSDENVIVCSQIVDIILFQFSCC